MLGKGQNATSALTPTTSLVANAPSCSLRCTTNETRSELATLSAASSLFATRRGELSLRQRRWPANLVASHLHPSTRASVRWHEDCDKEPLLRRAHKICARHSTHEEEGTPDPGGSARPIAIAP